MDDYIQNAPDHEDFSRDSNGDGGGWTGTPLTKTKTRRGSRGDRKAQKVRWRAKRKLMHRRHSRDAMRRVRAVAKARRLAEREALVTGRVVG